jgi:nitrile hydratase
MADETPYRGVHDMGGQAGGAVDRAEHETNFFEKRVDALMRLLSHPDRRLITVDELRRGIESLDKEDYFTLTYYERWLLSITHLLLEKGVLTEDELGARIHELQHRLGVADHEHHH